MNSDFKLFELSETNDTISTNECKHENVIIDCHKKICEDCGSDLDEIVSFKKEWRYYGNNDSKLMSDPNRCQIRKKNIRGIHNDISNMGLSDRIINIANNLYNLIAKGIHRGKSRKGIIFACVFHAYKIDGNPQSCMNLIELFGIERKNGLAGLKYYNLNMPKNNKNINYIHITAENIIVEIMNKFEATDIHKQDVIELYKQIKNKSSYINRARPQSIASGLVRYYILIKQKQISMQEFKEKVNLSELTIENMVKEIAKILGNKTLL